MNIWQQYLDTFRNHYQDVKGRASRREYWTFSLINWVVLAAFGGLIEAFSPNGQTGILGNIIVGILLIFMLAILAPSIAVSIRRLHDRGISGWLCLIGIVPYLGALVLFIFHLLPSAPETNKWGPDPHRKDAPLMPQPADW